MAPERRMEEVRKSITVGSSAWSDGGAIPKRHTCQGADLSPPITIRNLPDGTRAIAGVLDDPDAPRGTFTHWTFWNLPATLTELAEGETITRAGAVQGRNDFGNAGYGGPCPPQGEEHRYFLKIYALREPIDLAPGAEVAALYDAIEGKVLARGELMGTYRKE